jgi:uncharacterized protein (DUF433 family)
MDEHPLVYFRDGISGRRPALLGTRLNIADVIETLRQKRQIGRADSRIPRVPADRIEACLRYYGDEIDEWIDRARAIAEREEARWQRRGPALA